MVFLKRFTPLWRTVSLLATLILATALAIKAQRPPMPLGLEVSPRIFSATRALAHLDWIAAEPHPVGSTAHVRVRERLEASFRAEGLEVQTQQAQVPQGSSLTWVVNVMARLRGTESREAVLLVAHYDSVPGSYGAADDGAGVAAILETLRALKAGPPPRHDVIFLITDGEELGLLGAQAFVLHHPWRADVKRVLNLEARGTGGPVQMFETSEGNAELVHALADAWPHPTATSLAFEIYRRMPNGTDMTVFRQAGLSGMGFAFIDRPWDYHHPTDHPTRLDPGSLQQMGEAALGLTRALANGDLGPGSGRNAVYFNPFGFHFLSYPSTWVPWLSLLGLALTVAALIREFRTDGLTLAGWSQAIALLLLSLGVATALGALLGRAVSWLHPLWGVKEHFALTFNTWYVLVSPALVSLLLWLLPKAARAPRIQAALPAAGWTAWALLTASVSAALPGASYLFQGPLLLALLGTLLFPRRLWAQLPALLCTTFLFGPLAVSLVTGLGFGAGLTAGFSALLLLAAWLLWPVMARLREGSVLLPASAGLLFLGLIAGGLWGRTTFRGRAFANVRYTANLDTGRAWWVMERNHLGPWTHSFLGAPQPGHPSWEGDGRIRPKSESIYVHQEAPLVEVPSPKLTLLSDSSRDGLRTLRLTLVSAGAEEVWIRGDNLRFGRGMVEGHLLRSVPWVRSAGETRILQEPGLGDWRLILHAPPATPIEVELVFTFGPLPIDIGVQARFQGLPAALGAQADPPPGILPIREGNCTWVGRTLHVQ